MCPPHKVKDGAILVLDICAGKWLCISIFKRWGSENWYWKITYFGLGLENWAALPLHKF